MLMEGKTKNREGFKLTPLDLLRPPKNIPTGALVELHA